MIFYVGLAVSDIQRSATFYDAFLAELNAKRFVERENRFIAWGTSFNDTLLSVFPKSNKNSDPGSQESVISFEIESTEEVDRLFAKGLRLGATVALPITLNERGSYSGCLKDYDGHTLRLLCVTA